MTTLSIIDITNTSDVTTAPIIYSGVSFEEVPELLEAHKAIFPETHLEVVFEQHYRKERHYLSEEHFVTEWFEMLDYYIDNLYNC